MEKSLGLWGTNQRSAAAEEEGMGGRGGEDVQLLNGVVRGRSKKVLFERRIKHDQLVLL